MKPYPRFSRQWLLMVPPFLATSILTNIPTSAATLALSQSDLYLTNFSQNVTTIELVNQANISAKTNGGIFAAQNNANNKYSVSPPEISSSAFSLAFGNNNDYAGKAETQAQIVANFDVDANEYFNFDFTVSLNLQTHIDNFLLEHANAKGDISLLLFDTTTTPIDDIRNFFSSFISLKTGKIKYNPLDFLAVNAKLNTPGFLDSIDSQHSQNITLSQQLRNPNFSGNDENASIMLKGSLKRYFAQKSNLTLLALRRNQTHVSVAEPRNQVGLVLLAIISAMGVYKFRNPAKIRVKIIRNIRVS
jgi:hypothetical protein